MRDMILNTNSLPEPLIDLFRSQQIRVRETGRGVILMPVEKNQTLDAIKKARGMYTDRKLSVDRFLAEKRGEEAER